MNATLAVLAALAAAAAEGDEALETTASLEVIAAGRGLVPREGAANPDNRVLALPTLGAGVELRPRVKLAHGRLSAVVWPRAATGTAAVRAGDELGAERFETAVELGEAYGAFVAADWLTLTWGLQSFQWGPAELASPSNRLFHEPGLVKDPLFFQPGRHLVRANLTAGAQLSLVVLAEVSETEQPVFRAGERFAPQALAKAEWTSESGAHYLGLVGGAKAEGKPWVGEYGMATLADGLSVYADASHGKGSEAFHPVETPVGPVLVSDRAGEDRVYTALVAGLRYSFESGADLRVEWAFDEAGLGREALEDAHEAVTRDPRQLPLWLAPGLERLGRQGAYASLRLPELPPGKRLTLSPRWLQSVEDGSGAGFLVATFDATDSLVAFASALVTAGPESGALSGVATAAVAAGVIQSF